jgi:hypothetical protein
VPIYISDAFKHIFREARKKAIYFVCFLGMVLKGMKKQPMQSLNNYLKDHGMVISTVSGGYDCCL